MVWKLIEETADTSGVVWTRHTTSATSTLISMVEETHQLPATQETTREGKELRVHSNNENSRSSCLYQRFPTISCGDQRSEICT